MQCRRETRRPRPRDRRHVAAARLAHRRSRAVRGKRDAFPRDEPPDAPRSVARAVRVARAPRFVTHRLPSTVHVILRMRRAPPIPILFAVACVAARAAGLPTPVLSRLPPGYEVMAARQGPDVDAGRISYLIVLHRPADSASEPSPRPLVIVEQQADGTFRLAARNDEVVLRANEGGQCDPFDPQDADENGLAVKGRFFTVQNFVACGQHWSDYVTFRHDARTGRWLFANESAPSRSRSKASRTACARSGPIRESRWRSMHGAAATKRRLSGD
ncbi:hypothetical protein LRP76_20405 [Burkholderia pseudomallei]|nr:hypothetical protein [Burkholderia pseudomallei]MCD4520926.1 hypothetical protein [Burkholderia pseudomallei]MCL4669261.1 hypothetical protein [Burkholderia pseudomallei]MCW0133437.1 hypothetical protein [Burkholderia pseudomallei]MDE3328888.1 hypothetical protein [Burkholderia pseudomallei]MEB5488417.1 hypothetical protein [Burkholderia pseudomallei]